MVRLQENLKFSMIFYSSIEIYSDYSGVRTKEVIKHNSIKEIDHMNDSVFTKLEDDLMKMNSANIYTAETFRVRSINSYHPLEHYGSCHKLLQKAGT
jgi:dTDP-glucose 4,6-dehydratase